MAIATAKVAEVPDTVLTPGKKRGPGRPRKSSLEPGTKRLKRVSDYSPHHEVPEAYKHDVKPRGLPTKLNPSQTLPCLSAPQALDLLDADYASIATSGVLGSSLERSRISWTHAGVFNRYWTKPETGKGAAPPPADNPDAKSMKSRGRCRLRIEPHIFEVEIFVVERPRPPIPKSYQTAKQQNQVQQQWLHAQRQPQAHGSSSTSPFGSPHSSTQNLPTSTHDRTAQHQLATPERGTADQDSITNPVIDMLTKRGASDPELAVLMCDVAAKRASEAQMVVLQRHIDEVTALLKAQNAKDAKQAKATGSHTPQAQKHATYPQPHTPYIQQPPYTPPAPPAPSEVAFAFMTPGACADRFLFPEHAIIELLTPQHMLASFFVTRKGSDAVDPASFDSQKTYYFPVTIMVEVAYGREGILGDIKRWVKPPAEARAFMQNIMATHERLVPSHLALRLPLKSTADSSSMPNSQAGTPGPTAPEEKERKKRESKLNMPAAMYKKRGIAVDHAEVDVVEKTPDSTQLNLADTESTTTQPSGAADTEKEASKAEVSNDNRRSSRTTRKSSRLSEL